MLSWFSRKLSTVQFYIAQLTRAAERQLSFLARTTLFFFSNLMLSRTASHLSWPFTQYNRFILSDDYIFSRHFIIDRLLS